jgi:hypothetical protein
VDFLFYGFAKGIASREEMQNVNEFRDRIVRAAEYVTNDACQQLSGNGISC